MPKFDTKWRMLGVLLIVLGALYLGSGAWKLVRGGGKDIWHRVNGLTRIFAHEPVYPDLEKTPPAKDIDAVAPDAPWGWLGNAAFYPPALGDARIGYYILLSSLAVAFMAAWGWSTVGAADIGCKLMAAGSVLAVSSYCTCVGLGQNALLLMASLVAFAWALQRQWFWIAGIFLGIALSKPNIAGLFVLPVIVPFRPKAWVSAAVVMVVAMAWICWMQGQGPLELTRNWARYVAQPGTWPGYDFSQLLRQAGMAKEMSIRLAGVAGLLICAVLCVIYRRAELMVPLAICGVIGRLATYHQLYDNSMVVFLLAGLWLLYIRERSAAILVTFFAVGASLWAPARLMDIRVVQLLQMAVWCAGLGIYLVHVRKIQPLHARSGESEPAAEKKLA